MKNYCKNCKKQYIKKKPTNYFCSRECAKEYRYGSDHKELSTCPVCFSKFYKKNIFHVFCSHECRNIDESISRTRKEYGEESCLECKKKFLKKSSKNVFCSYACNRKYFNFKYYGNPEKKIRFKILVRDGFRCIYCGRGVSDGAVLEVDHINPVFSGGKMIESNLVTSCKDCNVGKSNIIYEGVKEYAGKFTTED